MLRSDLRLAVAIGAATLALGGCGGGDDKGFGQVNTPGNAPGSEVPSSALQSADGLVAFLKQLIGQTSDSTEPIALGDVVLPVDDRAEPAPVN